MLKTFQNTILVVLLLFVSSESFAVDKIEFYSPSNDAFLNTYVFSAPFSQTTESFLELGDNINAQVVKITSNTNHKFKVAVQFETSLTVMDEGPHFDLTEWKHCTSDWVDLESTKQNEFKLPKASSIDESCFPAVSDDEIRTEVNRVAGERWSALLQGDLDVNNYPLGVSLSTVRVRVEEEVNGIWEPVTTINFIVPLGC